MEAANPCLRELRLERAFPSIEMGPLDLAPLMRDCSAWVLVVVVASVVSVLVDIGFCNLSDTRIDYGVGENRRGIL